MMIQKILDQLKITELNPMQVAKMEAAGKGGDLMLLSPTGSGKTIGFLLSVLQNLKHHRQGVQALVLVPSRELAIQIEQVFKQMNTGFKSNSCYGGHAVKTEKNNLSHAPALLIGTPGRIAYHLQHGNVAADGIHTLVLDEFDKSLEFGFKNEMSQIVGRLKGLKQRILTSATVLESIPDFVGVRNIAKLNYLEKEANNASSLQLKYVRTADSDKLELLFNLICYLQDKSSLVFCNHRDAVDRIGVLLAEKGLPHGVFHGGMEQEERERSLIKFRNGSFRMLITTDLAARGLDIPEIEAVIHYQLPNTLDVFTHRNGRTARMNANGTAYLLLAKDDYIPEFIEEMPEQFTLPEKLSMPPKVRWRTLYIAAGKKDKINKMDIVGMLLQKGQLQKDELGLIEVLDNTAYAAVAAHKIEETVQRIRNEKIKNKKVRMVVSR